MVMSVAFVTDQRSVELWPGSTDVGSAVKLLMTGLSGGGGGCGFVAGGGGGGGGVFFLHPEAINRSASNIISALSCAVLNFRTRPISYLHLLLVIEFGCPRRNRGQLLVH